MNIYDLFESVAHTVPKIVYHVTPANNLNSIMKHGLRPSVGDRSNKIPGEQNGIFVFPDIESAEDAVMNWLGDEFGDDVELSLLSITTSGLENKIAKGADYEYIIKTQVSPNRIKVVPSNLEEAGGTGVIASKKQAHDPRYSMSLTKDVRPGQIQKNLRAFNLVESEEPDYDNVLVDLCELIIDNKRKNNKNGLVAASVVDGNRRVDATSSFNGKWVHAERNAINKFIKQYGKISDNAVIVTTLSPCVDPMSDRRGTSCSELISTTPIRRVYCGYRDPEHQELNNNLDISFTDNGHITSMCKAFADTFQKEHLSESTSEPKLKEVGNKFVNHCVKSLGIEKLPTIRLVSEIGTSEHPTFGVFDPMTNTVRVAYRDRHIMDVLRTLGHELVHHRQREENRIKPGDGETGSDIENEANAQAGVLMRDFADENSNLFKTDINEFYCKELTSPREVIEYVQSNIMPVLLEHYTQLTHWVNSRSIAARIFNKQSVNESVFSTSEKILNTFSRLDQRKYLDINIGSKVAVLNLVMSSHGGLPHLFGFTEPKTITKIHREPTEKTIVKIEFNNDPTQTWPRQHFASYKGQQIDHSALFPTKQDADNAVQTLILSAPADMPINIDGLT